MGLHGGTVDQDLLSRPSGLRERMEQVAPDALCRPADIAVVESFSRPVVWWSVDPATTRLQHIDDPADHPTIVNPRLASRVRRQMRFDLRKRLRRKPEMVPIHLRFLSEAVNHKSNIMPTPLWVRTLVQERRGGPEPRREAAGGRIRPNKTKQNQAEPNKTKLFCLVLFGFIRPNGDFSMGYGESK